MFVTKGFHSIKVIIIKIIVKINLSNIFYVKIFFNKNL